MIRYNDSQEITAHIITVRPSFEMADNRQSGFKGSFWHSPKANLSSFGGGNKRWLIRLYYFALLLYGSGFAFLTPSCVSPALTLNTYSLWLAALHWKVHCGLSCKQTVMFAFSVTHQNALCASLSSDKCVECNSIHPLAMPPFRGSRGAAANPSRHWARGRVRHGQITSQSQGWHIETDNHSHSCSHLLVI